MIGLLFSRDDLPIRDLQSSGRQELSDCRGKVGSEGRDRHGLSARQIRKPGPANLFHAQVVLLAVHDTCLGSSV
jgi:hypothetical protein